jgi:Ca2+-binding RTX toxin-like protein
MSKFRARAALVAAVAACGVAAAPGVADAAITPTLDPVNQTIRLDGDATNDNVALFVAAGDDSISYRDGNTIADTDIRADDATVIVVNGFIGDDTVDASALAAANYGTLTINGDAGNDLLTGGFDADTIHGNADNDRIVPFKGADVATGDDGNDTLVWNNGDGDDTFDGNAGTDATEFNNLGLSADTFTAGPNGARTSFIRTSGTRITMDVDTEALNLNSDGGNDRLDVSAGLGARIAINVNAGDGDDALNGGDEVDTFTGGIGNDTLNGGDANDLLNGGDGDDVLNGGNGDDRVVGDKGRDMLLGGNGNDVLVWNNGDGDDLVNGDAGVDVTEFNGGSTNDAFTAAPSGTRTSFIRTSGTVIHMDIDTEALNLNSFAGDDTLAVSAGLGGRIAFNVNAGDGNDTLVGADEIDSFAGGAGSDKLTGGAGFDLLDGGADNDAIFSRDNVSDLVRGGAGSDTAQTDATSVDAIDGVELVDAAVVTPPDVKAFAPSFGTAKVARSGSKLSLKVPVSCPKTETGGCTTSLTAVTSGAIRIGGVKLVARLGSAKVTLKAGETKTVTIRLVSGAAKLARHGKLGVRVAAVSTDAAKNQASSSKAFKVSVPKAKKAVKKRKK